jgi:hypothetical protein
MPHVQTITLPVRLGAIISAPTFTLPTTLLSPTIVPHTIVAYRVRHTELLMAVSYVVVAFTLAH